MKMTSRIGLVLLLSVLVSSVAFGQIGIKKGLKGGLNIATLRLDDDQGLDLSNRTGISGGVFLEIAPPVFPLSVEVNALFSQKGAKATQTVGTFSQDLKANINYLDIPVLAKFRIPLAPTASYHIVAGPQLSFKLSEDFGAEDDEDDEDEEDTFTSTDFGLVFGFGVEFNALISSVSVDVRYALGLSDIVEEPTDPNETALSAKNGVIMLMVGLGL